MINKPYLLPDETALASEINFAIKKYDLLCYDSNNLKQTLNENKNWIVDPKTMPLLDMKLRESVASLKHKDKKSFDYLRGLCERVKIQKEVTMSPEFKFEFLNMTPENLVNIKSASFPAISKNFHYRFDTPNHKYQAFTALEKLSSLRPYLQDIQPYLNRMSGTYIPTKDKYHPRQLEFALPILYQIQKAKEKGIANDLIHESIDMLNKSYITSPEHFHVLLENVSKEGKFEKGYLDTLPNKDSIPADIQNAIKEVEQEIAEIKNGIPLTYSQLAIMTTAKTPELVKSIGEMMSKRYVSNELAAAIVDNVNAIAKTREDVNISHLTQTLTLIGQTSKMTPVEMTVLGDIIINQNKDLNFNSVRMAAKEVKEMDVRDVWSPPKMREGVPKRELELAGAER